jgi:YT521-B-like domain
MAGPVRRGGQSVHWAISPPRSNQSPTTSSRLSSSQSSVHNYFSPGDHRLVDNSPLPDDGLHVKTPTDSRRPDAHHALHNQSAPGMLERQYDLPSIKTPEMKLSLDQPQRLFKAKNNPRPAQKDDFNLDPLAPVKAMRPTGGKPAGSNPLHPLEKVEERAEEPDDVVQQESTTTSHQQQEEEKSEVSWGDCFAVEWISTRKLSFNHTRQIRNPWNHDREVKVSRDGTELEPTVGQKLLDEWHRLSEPQEQQPLTTFEGGGVDAGEGGGHGGGSKLDGSSSTKRLIRRRSAGESKEGERAY